MRGIVIGALILIGTMFNSVVNASTRSITMQIFYDELQPYGYWLFDSSYGYLWMPDEMDGFRPYYSNGHWVMTEHGNTWVSYYKWGWATFHYGRWIYDNYYGWLWQPGSDWGPAWVSWCFNTNSYGWAPLMPKTNVVKGFNYECPEDWWVFTPKYQIYASHSTSLYDASGNREELKHAMLLDNTYYNQFKDIYYATGPSGEEVCKITSYFICESTGQNMMVFKIENTQAPAYTFIKDCTIYLFRPDIVKTIEESMPDKPQNFITLTRPVNKLERISPIIRRAPFKDTIDIIKAKNINK